MGSFLWRIFNFNVFHSLLQEYAPLIDEEVCVALIRFDWERGNPDFVPKMAPTGIHINDSPQESIT